MSSETVAGPVAGSAGRGQVAGGRPGGLAAIGGTPVVRLTRLADAGCAEVWVKIEAANPTGSYQDRMALAMIEAAEADGRLRPGQLVVPEIPRRPALLLTSPAWGTLPTHQPGRMSRSSTTRAGCTTSAPWHDKVRLQGVCHSYTLRLRLPDLDDPPDQDGDPAQAGQAPPAAVTGEHLITSSRRRAPLTDADRLVLAARFEQYLSWRHVGPASPRSAKETAERIGWPPHAVAKRCENIRSRYARLGVPGLRGSHALEEMREHPQPLRAAGCPRAARVTRAGRTGAAADLHPRAHCARSAAPA